MTIYQDIRNDFKAARIDRDSQTSAFLSTIIGEAQTAGVDRQDEMGQHMTIFSILRAFSKRNNQVAAIEGISEENRDKIKAELAIIHRYLPLPASADEIRNTLAKIVSENPDRDAVAMKNASSSGWFVGQIVKAHEGNVDVELVKSIVKERYA